jgi:hypothetical protein
VCLCTEFNKPKALGILLSPTNRKLTSIFMGRQVVLHYTPYCLNKSCILFEYWLPKATLRFCNKHCYHLTRSLIRHVTRSNQTTGNCGDLKERYINISLRDCVSSDIKIETNGHRQVDRQTIHIVMITQSPLLHFRYGSRLRIVYS